MGGSESQRLETATCRLLARMSASDPDPPDLLDTNVVARYLVGDAPQLAARAAALIDSDHPLRISVIALAELGFVLTRL